MTSPAKFQTGRVVVTSGALEELRSASPDFSETELAPLLAAHTLGDWGDVDAHDKRMNNEAVKSGARILSSYELHGVKLWVMTDAASDVCPACWAGIGTCEPDKGQWSEDRQFHFRTDLPPRRLATTILRPDDY